MPCEALPESLHLPRLPEGIDAVLLDELTDPDGFAAAQAAFWAGGQAARDRRDRADTRLRGPPWRKPRGIACCRRS